MSTLTNMRVGVAVMSNALSPRREGVSREQHRYAIQEWRKWYKSKRWFKLRLFVLARDGYTCQEKGCGILLVHKPHLLVAHHHVRHKGNPAIFWDPQCIHAVCKPCHDGPIQIREKANNNY